MEILGLAIVVVLVLIATIFVIRFIVLKAPVDYRKGFVSSELSSNILNTFLKTNARECSSLTMKELIQECAQGTGFECQDIHGANIGNACKYANDTAKRILRDTLTKWNYKYELLAWRENEKPIISLGSSCLGEKSSKIFPIPIRAATVYVKLDVCN